MGDVLRFLPLAGALKRRYSRVRITWVVGARCRDLVAMCRDVDEVLVMDVDPLSPRWRWPGALLRFAPRLRKRRYDFVIDAHSTPLSAGVAILARTGRRLGIDKPVVSNFRLFPFQPVDKRSAGPIDYHLSVLRFFGVDLQALDPSVDLDPGDAARAKIRTFLSQELAGHRPLVVVHHDTSLHSKRWPAERFGELANRLRRERNASVVVVGERRDARLEAIRRRCDPAVAFTHDLSIPELAALFQACDLAVALESGPLHLAAGLSRPTIGIFGPSDPAIHTPYGDRHVTAREPVHCSPCFEGFRFCFTCPLSTMECLLSLEVENVMAATGNVLGSLPARGPLAGPAMFGKR